LLLILFFTLVGCSQKQDSLDKEVFLFFYFEEKAAEKAGLFSAYSYDLHYWYKAKDSLITAKIGEYGVFRDPSLTRTKDGEFHLVWTCGSSGFGYAHSNNGVNWEDIKFITVEDSTRNLNFANVWAPEFYTEGDSTYVIWSSTLTKDYIPPKDPKKWWNSTWNHRLYYTATTDFKDFSPYPYGHGRIDLLYNPV